MCPSCKVSSADLFACGDPKIMNIHTQVAYNNLIRCEALKDGEVTDGCVVYSLGNGQIAVKNKSTFWEFWTWGARWIKSRSGKQILFLVCKWKTTSVVLALVLVLAPKTAVNQSSRVLDMV